MMKYHQWIAAASFMIMNINNGNMMTKMQILIGNTYAIKDQIKAKGGKWDFKAKCWKVPADVYAELQSLANEATKSNFNLYKPSMGKCFECADCGGDVYRGTTCWETGLRH